MPAARLYKHKAIVIIFSALMFHTACETPDTRQQTSPKQIRYLQEIEAFQELDNRNGFPADAILFVGSSSIRMWNTADAFGQWPVINRGFGGSTIPEVQYYADKIIYQYNPRLIVFYAGDNDIAAGTPPQNVADKFKRFVHQTRNALPNTPIIFLSIKPSPARIHLWPQMQEANRLIRDDSLRHKNLYYLDLTPCLLDERGQLRTECFRGDGLHLSNKGYACWTSTLTQKINELLKSL